MGLNKAEAERWYSVDNQVSSPVNLMVLGVNSGQETKGIL